MGGTIVDVPNTVTKRRRRSSHVRFKEEEEIINPGSVYYYPTYVQFCCQMLSYDKLVAVFVYYL